MGRNSLFVPSGFRKVPRRCASPQRDEPRGATGRRTVQLKLIAVETVLASVDQQSPLATLLNVWAFCGPLTDFFRVRTWRQGFRRMAPIVLKACRVAEADILGVVRIILPQEEFERIEQRVDSFVKERPIVRYSLAPFWPVPAKRVAFLR